MSTVVAGAVALLHFYFMYLEMFVWTNPKGLRIFGQTAAQAESSKVLAFNQGLYNGFLAAGLVWSLLEPEPGFAKSIRIFFFSCVLLAGLVGGWSVNKKIYFVQALPALIGLVVTFGGF